MYFFFSDYLPTAAIMYGIHCIPTMITIICILIATYILKKVVLNFLKTTFTKAHIDPMIQELLYNTATWFLYATSLILILENIGIHAGLLVSTFGITGLTIGLAVKDMVSKYCSWNININVSTIFKR